MKHRDQYHGWSGYNPKLAAKLGRSSRPRYRFAPVTEQEAVEDNALSSALPLTSTTRCGQRTWEGTPKGKRYPKVLFRWHCRSLDCKTCRTFWVQRTVQRLTGAEAQWRAVFPWPGQQQLSLALEMARREAPNMQYLWILNLDRKTGELTVCVYLAGATPDVVGRHLEHGKPQKVEHIATYGKLFESVSQDLNHAHRYQRRKRIVQASRGFFLSMVDEPKRVGSGMDWMIRDNTLPQVLLLYHRAPAIKVQRMFKGEVGDIFMVDWTDQAKQDSRMITVPLGEDGT